MNVLRRRTSAAPRLFVVGLLLFVAACHRQQPPSPPVPVPQRQPTPVPVAVTNGPTLVQAMHDRYASVWYRSFTFTQKTTVSLSSGGQVVQTWYDAGTLPGNLRIDTDRTSKDGVLYARDSIFSFNNGKLVHADTGVNELLVLGFDVYVQPAARTEAVLRRLGFDLRRFHETTWHGAPVYVVGAIRGDTDSKQFWVDGNTLLLVRLLEHNRQGLSDFRIAGYQPFGGGWMATEVEQLENGKRRILEQYRDIRTNVDLSESLFDPKRWSTTPHWASKSPPLE